MFSRSIVSFCSNFQPLSGRLQKRREGGGRFWKVSALIYFLEKYIYRFFFFALAASYESLAADAASADVVLASFFVAPSVA